MFVGTSIVKNSDKEKWVYSGFEIAFNGKGTWSFGHDYARNVVIIGVDVSSSSHADNHKNNFLVFAEEDTFSINGSFGAPEKKFSINFTKAKTKFCLSLHWSGDNSYVFVKGKEIFKFKADNGNFSFPTQFCLGSISNEFGATDSIEVSGKGNLCDFSVGYNI